MRKWKTSKRKKEKNVKFREKLGRKRSLTNKKWEGRKREKKGRGKSKKNEKKKWMVDRYFLLV